MRIVQDAGKSISFKSKKGEIMGKKDEIMDKVLIVVFGIVGVIAVVAGLGLILAFPIKWCWNATMPYLFALPTITWGKAWCLNLLTGLLIKSSHTINYNKD